MNQSAINPELLSVLACPICANRPALTLQENELICKECQNRFTINNGIPNLIPEEAISTTNQKEENEQE